MQEKLQSTSEGKDGCMQGLVYIIVLLLASWWMYHNYRQASESSKAESQRQQTIDNKMQKYRDDLYKSPEEKKADLRDQHKRDAAQELSSLLAARRKSDICADEVAPAGEGVFVLTVREGFYNLEYPERKRLAGHVCRLLIDSGQLCSELRLVDHKTNSVVGKFDNDGLIIIGGR